MAVAGSHRSSVQRQAGDGHNFGSLAPHRGSSQLQDVMRNALVIIPCAALILLGDETQRSLLRTDHVLFTTAVLQKTLMKFPRHSTRTSEHGQDQPNVGHTAVKTPASLSLSLDRA